MREALIYLSHLDHEDTEKQVRIGIAFVLVFSKEMCTKVLLWMYIRHQCICPYVISVENLVVGVDDIRLVEGI